ncbi:MAG: hypothetical protein K2P94_16785 [Rhodospirillaceae bacterium]|nr:hypothetical protein [Rhodospirillaceae bacterium]
MQNTTAATAHIGGLFSHPLFLRRILLLDAAICVATGLVMATGAATVSQLTQLPSALLSVAGASLFPIALFMALVATRRPIPSAGAWLVILGNAGWVIGSLALLTGTVPFNALGAAFVLTQALAVAGLAVLETIAVRKR